MTQIDELLGQYGALIAASSDSPPGLVQITALASVLHSFYTGVESIFAAIARSVDGSPPQGDQWHRELLGQMSSPTDRRPPVISQDTRDVLEAYLGFRHFYRHAYSFLLDWQEMRGLTLGLRETWSRVKQDMAPLLEAD